MSVPSSMDLACSIFSLMMNSFKETPVSFLNRRERYSGFRKTASAISAREMSRSRFWRMYSMALETGLEEPV